MNKTHTQQAAMDKNFYLWMKMENDTISHNYEW